jgi:general secretion pathway protein L
MSSRLLLALDEHWPATPACPWVLLGADDRPISEGLSEPRHWPAAAACEVLLLGAQCLWLEVPLPGAARRDLPRLIAYALEDRLLKDPDTQHLTVSHRRPAGDGERDLVGVLIVARERMRALIAQLSAIGRSPQSIVAEVQTAPGGSDAWHLSMAGSGAVLRVAPSAGIALDAEMLAPLLAQHAANARAANQPPAHVDIHVAAGSHAPDLAALAADAALGMRSGAPYLWWQGASRQAANLLHGEFASRERNSAWLARVRPPLLLAAAALLLWLVAGLGEVLWLRGELAASTQRTARAYQSAFPKSPVVSPAAQMRQQLNLERARHGLLRDDDALALLAEAAAALGTDAADSIAALQYADGRLDLSLSGPAAERADALTGLLKARGLLTDLRRDGAAVHLVLRRETLQ